MWGEGGGSKNSEEIRRGAELILLLRTGVGARHNNCPLETHFSAPLLTIIAQSLNDLQFLVLELIHFAF